MRLYEEQDFLARPEFTDPEVLRTSLASVILQMAALGLGEEQLRDAANPRAPANRRVQVIAVGKLEPVEPKAKPKVKGR